MSLQVRTERALQACYDALIMPDRWPTALQQLADALDVSSCTFASIGDRPYEPPISTGHYEFTSLWCRNRYHAPCPYTALLQPELLPSQHEPAHGKALPFVSNYVIDDQVVTADDRKTMAYFHETAGPGKREWWAAGSFAIADRQWCLSVYRDRARGRFSHDEGRYLAKVAPGFGRIVELAEKFEAAKISSALTAFDRLKCPALIIDWDGAVRNLNRLAESILEKDLHLCRGRLIARDPASNRRLQQLVAAILAAAPCEPPTLSQVVINRADAPWLLIDVMPLTALGSDTFNGGRVVLILTDLTKPSVSDSKLLAILFGLTPAEAKLATAIASGIGIDAAAAALRIGRETVKSQLKAVFLKTNTRSQPELVALLGRLRSTKA
jgi:DNA-binding CsgD family transcriptional regulator